MKPVKALALIVPAGLLLGMAAGAATRPVMIQNARDYWPSSIQEANVSVDAWRPIYQGGPQDLTPERYSYRPDLDYEALAYAEQDATDYWIGEAEESLQQAADFHPQGNVERAADRAQAAVEDVLAATQGSTEAPAIEVIDASTVPTPVAPMVTQSF